MATQEPTEFSRSIRAEYIINFAIENSMANRPFGPFTPLDQLQTYADELEISISSETFSPSPENIEVLTLHLLSRSILLEEESFAIHKKGFEEGLDNEIIQEKLNEKAAQTREWTLNQTLQLEDMLNSLSDTELSESTIKALIILVHRNYTTKAEYELDLRLLDDVYKRVAYRVVEIGEEYFDNIKKPKPLLYLFWAETALERLNSQKLWLTGPPINETSVTKTLQSYFKVLSGLSEIPDGVEINREATGKTLYERTEDYLIMYLGYLLYNDFELKNEYLGVIEKLTESSGQVRVSFPITHLDFALLHLYLAERDETQIKTHLSIAIRLCEYLLARMGYTLGEYTWKKGIEFAEIVEFYPEKELDRSMLFLIFEDSDKYLARGEVVFNKILDFIRRYRSQ